MKKAIFVCACLAISGLCCGAVFAEDPGGVLSQAKPGFQFNLALYADMIRFEKNTYEYANLRKSVNHQDSQSFGLPFSNLDWVSDDSNISAGYQTKWFGGKYTLKKSNITNFGAVQGWVQFGAPHLYLKIIAGNDNDFTYADALGADPGPRVYTGGTGNNWQAHKNPDNITQGNGVALSGVWNSLTLDLAASQFNVTPHKTQTPKPGTVNTYGDTEDKDFQYGGRLGWKFGDLGKVNASYILGYSKLGSKYGWDTKNLDIVAAAPDAEVWNHHYGVFASLYPLDSLGVTIGYSGIVTKYLDGYWSVNGELSTTYPLIWKHALNLNANCKTLDGKLRLRTDHSMTVYKDKNYNTFEIAGAAWTQDYNASSAGQNYAEIQHFFLWNGLGAEYDLAQFGEGRKITLNCYARNLLRQDTAQSGLIEQEYIFIRDEIKVDLQAKYFFSETVSVFAGFRFQDALTFRSKDLTGQIPGYFLGSMKMPRDAIETIDSKFTLSIPVGILLAW